MRIFKLLLAAALASSLPVAACAQTSGQSGGQSGQSGGFSEEGFRAYLPLLRAEAIRQGVRPQTIDSVFPTLAFSARTVELDRGQPGGTTGYAATPAFAPYKARHVTPALISRGRERYATNMSRLREIERNFGVSPSVLMAIWGHETSYGAVTGDFDLLNSLASLAYEGRRRQLFADEFVATMKMLERGYPRSQLKGSWAGATGYPQFLPSVYLRLAVDGDRDGRANIWNSVPDALASIANYLDNAGWKANTRWGVEVSLPAGFDRSRLGTRLIAPRCPRVHERHSKWLTIREWRQMGVIARGAWPADDELASLLEPDGLGRPAYLLTNNYRVILDYNCSNFYALSVGLLADEIAR